MEAQTTFRPHICADQRPATGSPSLAPAPPDWAHDRRRTDSQLLRPSLQALAIDTGMVALSIAAAAFIPLTGTEVPSGWLVSFALTVVVALTMRGAYAPRLRSELLDTLRRVIEAVVLAAMGVISVCAVATENGALAHDVAGLALYTAALLAAGRAGLSYALSRGLLGGDLRRRTLILGAGKVGNLTAKRLLASPDLGLQPVGFLDDDPLEVPGEEPALPLLGGPPDIDRIVAEHQVEHFIVGFSMASHQLMLGLVRRCWELGVSVSLVPRLFEIEGDRTAVDRLGGLPLVSLAAPPSKGLALNLKYAIDRVAAALGLVALAPLLALVALAIRLSMGPPVLYKQHRVGRDGRHFVLWKFRTMLGSPDVSGEANAAWAQAAASAGEEVRSFGGHSAELGGVPAPVGERCTPLGGFLRRLSIDELPQLWNVVRGEMSLIGPRPEMPHYVERFEEAIYRYSDRHRVKSGLTGWAQIHGLRGETSLADRVEWDNYYIENWSLWLDLKIALRTMFSVARDAAESRREAGAPASDGSSAAQPAGRANLGET